VRSFAVNNQTSDHPRLGEYVFLPKEGLAPSPGNNMSEARSTKYLLFFNFNCTIDSSRCSKCIQHCSCHTQVLGGNR
jgi:hypothetical protein